MTKNSLLQTIGMILIGSYWLLSIIVAINFDKTGQILGLIFVPFITIPLQIIVSLSSNIVIGLIELVWVGLGIFLVVMGQE